MNDLLTESQKHERDVRLYGVTVARWLRAQKNLGITQNTPGLGSNGEERQERDGYISTLECQHSPDGADRIQHKKDRLPVAFGPSVKTGYEPAVDNRQVPSPTISADKPFNLKSMEFYEH